MTPEQRSRNTRTGIFLSLVLAGVIAYSLIVIKTRGSLPEPTRAKHRDPDRRLGFTHGSSLYSSVRCCTQKNATVMTRM